MLGRGCQDLPPLSMPCCRPEAGSQEEAGWTWPHALAPWTVTFLDSGWDIPSCQTETMMFQLCGRTVREGLLDPDPGFEGLWVCEMCPHWAGDMHGQVTVTCTSSGGREQTPHPHFPSLGLSKFTASRNQAKPPSSCSGA